MKSPIKMLFPTVIFIFPAMFTVILGPAMLNLMEPSMAPGEHEIEQGFGTGLRAQLQARRESDEPAKEPESQAAASMKPVVEPTVVADGPTFGEVDAIRQELYEALAREQDLRAELADVQARLTRFVGACVLRSNEIDTRAARTSAGRARGAGARARTAGRGGRRRTAAPGRAESRAGRGRDADRRAREADLDQVPRADERRPRADGGSPSWRSRLLAQRERALERAIADKDGGRRGDRTRTRARRFSSRENVLKDQEAELSERDRTVAERERELVKARATVTAREEHLGVARGGAEAKTDRLTADLERLAEERLAAARWSPQ